MYFLCVLSTSPKLTHEKIKVDYMELKREANGNFIWFVRMRLPDSELPYLLCQKPLKNKGSFNPISWSAFGAPLRFPDGFRPGKDLPNFNDSNVLNSLTSPNELWAALKRGKISKPHRRRQWEPIEFHMLETPVTLFVYAEDSQQFLTELREYLGMPPPPQRKEVDYDAEEEMQEEDEEDEIEFGLSNSGRVALHFACATEALKMYDVLDKKRMAPRIKVFHTALEVESVIQDEHARIANEYMEEKLNFVPPTFDNRLGDYDPETLETFLHNETIEDEEREWKLSEEEEYGRFVIESQIAMRSDPEISRIEINSLQVATIQCRFDLKDPDLFRQNKKFSGSIREMLEPVHEPEMPRIVPDDSFFKLPN